MLRIDEKTTAKEIYEARDNDQVYKDALQEYKATLETNDTRKIDDAVGWMETIACDVVYKKAFHDGMSFILNALAGKEVIEI